MINLISLSTVKTQLGIAVTTYDAALTALIPIVSSDVRRILNDGFDKYVLAVFTSGSTAIDFGIQNQLYDGIYQPYKYKLGQVITHANIPADTYLSDIDPITGVYTMSAAATGDGTYVTPTIQICQFPAISKMIWYKYQKQTTGSAMEKTVSHISYDGVSKTFADSEINTKYNYPQSLINDLGTPYAKVN